MQGKTTLSIAAAAAVIFAAGVWFVVQNRNGADDQNGSPSPAASGAQLPDVSLTDYDGKTIYLADFAGKPLVVNSWAVWCPFCVKELSDFAAVQKEFSSDVVFIAIDRAEGRDTTKKFTDGLGITDDLVFLLDPSDSFYRSIGGFSMPETIFVKADGTIHFHKRGPMPIEEIRQRTQELLQQQ